MDEQNSKLFVGSLAWATTDQSLAQAFSAAGTVTDAKVITDRETGRSKGFGFVTMSTADEAQTALEMFHQKDLDGRTINVSFARPKEDAPRGGGSSRRW